MAWIKAARDPVTGPDVIINFYKSLDEKLGHSVQPSFETVVPYDLGNFGHADRFYEIISQEEIGETRWTIVSEYLMQVHEYRPIGLAKHPGYLEVAEKLGYVDVWEKRGPPDHCSKDTGEWVCE